MKTVKTSINCNRVGNCSLTLVLDKRTNKETMEYPMAYLLHHRTKAVLS